VGEKRAFDFEVQNDSSHLLHVSLLSVMGGLYTLKRAISKIHRNVEKQPLVSAED